MNILFLWFGMVEPLYEWRHRCIFRAKEMYPDAKFQVVTSLKDFYGMEIIDVNEISEEMGKEGYYTDVTQFAPFSDALRFWWLSKFSNTLYLDTDTWCKHPFKPTELPAGVSIEALWNGSEKKVFKEFLDKRRHGDIFISHKHELNIPDASEFFEHKPNWAKKYLVYK